MPGQIKIRLSCVKVKMIVLSLLIWGLGAGAADCSNSAMEDRGGGQDMSGKKIEQALKEHTAELMSTPGVVGTGQGLCDGKPCIKVYVTQKTPELEQRIQHILKGYPFLIEQSGRFRARPEKEDRHSH